EHELGDAGCGRYFGLQTVLAPSRLNHSQIAEFEALLGAGCSMGSDQIFSTFKIAAVSARVLRQASASRARSIPYVGMISFSLGSQPLSASSFAKHFSSTPRAMKAAVDAPGEAPSRATRDLSSAATSSVP